MNFPHRTRIKICGLTREADVDAAVEAGVDAIGFVCYEPSPRHLSHARAAQLAQRLPPFVTPVRLLVNPSPAELDQALQAMPQALLQFHGDESPELCQQAQRPYIRAARMRPDVDLLKLAQQYASAQALLLDAFVDGYGGSGKGFDWSLIPANVPARLVLSGGLNAQNVAEGIQRLRPWAVDVSSGVESAKGIKDAALIHQFVRAVQQADDHERTLHAYASPL